jgi:hypothetical protein
MVARYGAFVHNRHRQLQPLDFLSGGGKEKIVPITLRKIKYDDVSLSFFLRA